MYDRKLYKCIVLNVGCLTFLQITNINKKNHAYAEPQDNKGNTMIFLVAGKQFNTIKLLYFIF